ncbi:plexin-A1-like isoform X2 [Mya arenaria]|uniref:plexin-A1-like isoform X2 n=1 Tax=Mya arenaria TaxID=6604 RepID=UPI0022E00D24|nr:plexin-A1-like isoform X2 [Mya arenaria]
MYTTAVFCLFVLAAAFECNAEIVIRNKDGLTKIVHHKVKDNFFVAEKNKIYKFDSEFNILKEQEVNKTCGNKCNNTFTVALVDERNDLLILCGTHHGGLCETRNTSDLQQLRKIPGVFPTTETHRVQGMVTYDTDKEQSYLTIAKTLDYIIEDATYQKIIQRYIMETLTESTFVSLVSTLSFKIDYRSAFSSERYTYFFTNQLEDLRPNANYTSKISRMCNKNYRSFFDTPIQCEDYESYNVVQDALLVDVDRIKRLYITFAHAEQTGNSILCSAEMEDINQKLKLLQERAVNCSYNNTFGYLYSSSCLNGIDGFADLECVFNQPYFKSGKGTVKTNLLSKTNNKEGYITTLSTTKVENKDVLIAGTSNGFILKYVIDTSDLIKYESLSVQPNDQIPIKSVLQIDEESTYASTTTTVYKFSSTKCSEFRSCNATMEGKNPLCGWCVYSQRATRRNDCTYQGSPNHWLSALSNCTSLQLQPTGIPIGTNKTVKFIVKNLPQRLENDTYFCQVEDSQVLETVIQGDELSCTIVGKNEHKEVSMRLVVNHKTENISIAEAPFLFYNCSSFKRCGKCVETSGASCWWNTANGACSLIEGERQDRVNQSKDCPRLEKIHQRYIPSGVDTNLTLQIRNLNNIVQDEDKSSDADDISIHVEFQSNRFKCSDITTGSIHCTINGTTNIKKENLLLQIYYETESGKVYIDNPYSIDVIVYNCYKLSQGKCNYCNALKSDYICHWPSTGEGCVYGQNVSAGYTCPRPEITKILPRDGLTGPGTIITVYGNEFGTENDTIKHDVNDRKRPMIVNRYCSGNFSDNYIKDMEGPEDFSRNIRKSFQCKLGPYRSNNTTRNETRFYLMETISEINGSNVLPIWKKTGDVYVLSIEPNKGPAIGGTIISLTGKNLGIGNRAVKSVLFDESETLCVNSKVQSFLDPILGNVDFRVTCKVNINDKRMPGTRMKFSELTIPDKEHIKTGEEVSELFFNFLPNPEIGSIQPNKGFLSGGTRLTVKGQNLNSSSTGSVIIVFGRETQEIGCIIDPNSADQVLCEVPPATPGIRSALGNSNPSNSQRKKRSNHCDGCVTVKIIVKLDGVESSFTISYFHDPSINKFDNNVLLYETDQQYLEIEGENLNLVAAMHDINITIGLGECNVVELTGTYMRCKAPSSQPQPGIPGTTLPEVNVTIGNIHTTVGYIKYKKNFENVLIIAGAAAGAALFLLVLVVAFFVCKYRKVGSKAKALEKQLNNLELEIKHVAKEEFLDMQTSMSTVNRNLIEQGFPYHSYQQYACNAMFATDYLMSDPVMSDELRARARTGMERFQGLLENKFFLVSLITTMEKQKHFFIKEKSNFAGNLCAIMMGRMDYMHEVLQVLITQLVEDPSSKRDVKTLFRRSESITEKLLSNWLSLCLYPHLKDHTGSLLYLLYIATRKTMEAGPIDALTNDAKYTLSEEKLLRKYQGSATDEETTDVKFEAKALTLNVVVDNGEEIYPCKALDCDTVNQVKAKCLDQIYVNYPASQLPVDPTELLLEWHAGFSGRMILRDKDNTSKRDGEWIRVNTLAHYAVADQSNMALVDPRNAELSQQEDYVNLAQIDPGFDVNSMGSDQPLTAECSTSHDEENPMELKQWHLLKDDDANKKEKSAIDELYLNRLITTKLSLVKYIDDLFSLVLENSKCPPPVKFLYDFLDDLAEKQKIDPDTLHAWKSHSYSIRIWAMLIKTPSILFDINAPSYVSESLDVISQVFIESFSRTEQAVSKESPTQKLIFRNELTKFRTHVQEFYKNVKENVQKPDELGQYLTSINRNQQETTFNKNAALYRLYEQIKPYTDEILDDLSICQETRCLQLNKKLDDIFSMMEE